MPDTMIPATSTTQGGPPSFLVLGSRVDGLRVVVVHQRDDHHRHRRGRAAHRLGLGCSDWPLCTPDSLVPILEVQGIHGIIEFGNRLMTGVVGIIALAVVLLVLHLFSGKRGLVNALWFALGGIVAAVATFAIATPLHFPASPIAPRRPAGRRHRCSRPLGAHYSHPARPRPARLGSP